MFLSGPFKGAPLSLAAITPALAGPYDYGVVVVRVALEVDPLTAQVSALSDTVPSIIGGVPIRMRSIQVNIDKPNFTINPTNCSPFSVDSQGIGDQGTIADFSSYFNAVNCASLPFKPRMSIRQLGSRKATKRSRNPRMQFVLRTRSGDANIRSLTVTLPKAFAIDQRHLGNICSRAQLAVRILRRPPADRDRRNANPVARPAADRARPMRSRASANCHALHSSSTARSVLYPRQNQSSKGGRLPTTVPTVPDAPIGYFRLDLLGGKQGYLVNTRSLCTSPPNVELNYTAQSGKQMTQKVVVKTACGASKSRAKRKRHR